MSSDLVERGMPDRVKLNKEGERAIALDPSNHHNAVHCPHCNPGNEWAWVRADALEARDKEIAELREERDELVKRNSSQIATIKRLQDEALKEPTQ